MRRYTRRHGPRERYETWLVEEVNILGFDCELSTDFADERLGIDAWLYLDEIAIPVDFTTAQSDRVKALKTARTERTHGNAVFTLFVTDDLICDLRCQDKKRKDQARNKLWELVDALITATATIGTGCFLTMEKATAQERKFLRTA